MDGQVCLGMPKVMPNSKEVDFELSFEVDFVRIVRYSTEPSQNLSIIFVCVVKFNELQE